MHKRFLTAASFAAAVLVVAGGAWIAIQYLDGQKSAKSSSQPPAAAVARKEGPIRRAEWDHYFGTLKAGETRTHRYEIRNTSAQPLKITRAESSCSCLLVKSLPAEIAPGAVGVVDVSYTAPSPGATRAEIFVETNDPAGSIYALTWNGLISNPRPRAEIPAEAYVSAQDLRSQDVKDIALIDVRPAEKFAVLSIAGSMNYPLHVIKTLAHLKSREVVLVTMGHQDEMLLPEIARLKERGFAKIRILQDGLRGWSRAGGSFTAVDANLAEAVTIASSQFDALRSEEWAVVEAVASPAQPSGKIPGALPLQYAANWTPEQWTAAIDGLLKPHASVRRVLFVTEAGADYRQVESQWAQRSARPVYFLEGGYLGYSEWARMHTSMRDQQTVRVAASGQARTAASIPVVSRPAAGCSTCPGK